jgi:hypothetical protein
MRIPLKKVSYASVLLSLLAAAGVTAFTTPRRQQEPRQQEPGKVYVPKRFLSEVKNLKVERHWIENDGTPDAALVVIIRNKSFLVVTQVSVTIADLTVSRDGGAESDEPQTVIEPYATAQFSIPINNFIDNSPFVISAAIYADGTDEGREQQLRWAHKDRAEARAKRAAKKGGPER